MFSPFILAGALTTSAVSLPNIQKYITNKLASMFAEDLGMKLSVEDISLKLPLSLNIDGLCIVDLKTRKTRYSTPRKLRWPCN